MDIRPDYANLETRDGEFTRVAPDAVPKGSIIVVKPGEKIPLDGVVISGNSSLDTAALTGESLPREVREGSQVISGSMNMTGLLRVRTSGTYGESTVARILDLVENAENGKAKTEKFITRFAKYRGYGFAAFVHGRHRRCSTFGCNPSASGRAMAALASQGIDLPGHFMSLCAGHLHSSDIFCRSRRRIQTRHPHKRLELS